MERAAQAVSWQVTEAATPLSRGERLSIEVRAYATPWCCAKSACTWYDGLANALRITVCESDWGSRPLECEGVQSLRIRLCVRLGSRTVACQVIQGEDITPRTRRQ